MRTRVLSFSRSFRRAGGALSAGIVGSGFLALTLAGPVICPAAAQTAVPALWTAGGLDAGTTGAGQAARMTTDSGGNVAVVSGPAAGRDLAVTSYTAAGTLRWRRTVSPSSGTFAGDWIRGGARR